MNGSGTGEGPLGTVVPPKKEEEEEEEEEEDGVNFRRCKKQQMARSSFSQVMRSVATTMEALFSESVRSVIPRKQSHECLKEARLIRQDIAI